MEKIRFAEDGEKVHASASHKALTLLEKPKGFITERRMVAHPTA